MNTLAKVIKHRQMLAPVLIDHLQQHRALEPCKGFRAHQFQLGLILGIGRVHHHLDDVVIGDLFTCGNLLCERHREQPFAFKYFLQR